MTEEKVVNFNLDAAKKKVANASDKAISATNAKLKEASASIKERAGGKKEAFLQKLVEKGIGLTEKQLAALKKLKK